MTLPPLPEPHEVFDLWGQNVNVYTAQQMRDYAAAAVAAERAKWEAEKNNQEQTL